MSSRIVMQSILDALAMAVEQRRPAEGVIHHSDQGCQYTSIEFGKRCREAGVRPSMGSVGDCYDNAMCESFFATLECELLDRTRFIDRDEAELAVFDFIEGFYNTRRRHSALGYLAPVIFEQRKDPAARSGSLNGCHPLLDPPLKGEEERPHSNAKGAAFALNHSTHTIRPASSLLIVDAQLSTRPPTGATSFHSCEQNKGRQCGW